MVKIKDIAGVDPHTVEALKRQKIHTLEDLWRELGPDWHQTGADYEGGLAKLAQKTGLEAQKIQAVLGRGAHEPERRFGLNELVLLLGGLALLALLAWRWIAPLVSTPPAVLVAGQDLPAYHVLAETDLASAAKGVQADSFTQAAQVTGRYLLRPLRMGEVITADRLSEKTLDPTALADQHVLVIPLPAGRLDPSLEPGDPAWLVLSPLDPAVSAAAVETPALVLRLEKSGEITLATLAIPEERRSAVIDTLGSSLVVLQMRGEWEH